MTMEYNYFSFLRIVIDLIPYIIDTEVQHCRWFEFKLIIQTPMFENIEPSTSHPLRQFFCIKFLDTRLRQ